MRTGLVRPSASVTPGSVTREGTHVSYVTEFVTFPALGEDWRVTKADKLASFSEHPDALLTCLFSDSACMIHICEHNGGVFPKIMGGTRVMRHLGNRDVSENSIAPHLFYEGVWSCDVLLVVGGSDMS
jgi:hypothetical protein